MKILNFGSLNIDYVYSVEHIVIPGETIPSMTRNTFCGGKGLNQSIALAKAGAAVSHAGCIGKDGALLKELLINNGVNTDFVTVVDLPSGHAVIQVDQKGQNSIILYGGANLMISEEYVDRVLSHFEKNDILLLQNEINNIPLIMEKAHKKGMAIALNPSPISQKLKEYPLDYVKYFLLNEIEGYEITGEKESEAILRVLQSRYPDACIVLTLGKNGVLYCDREQKMAHGIYKADVVDTTAAGDTFTGYFLAGVMDGLHISKNLERASIASSIAVSRKGAASSIPMLDEVIRSSLHLKEEC